MKLLYYYLYHRRSNSGFSLTELLVAVSLTGVTAMLVGFGLVATMQAQKKASSEIAQRTNLNRALDFMTDEIRMANAISTPTTSELPTVACGTVRGMLKLTIPGQDPVGYYLYDRTGCSNNSWLAPATINRRVYLSGSAAHVVDNVLVDAIMPNSSSPSCSSTTDTSGFYASISNNRSVDLCIRGRMTTANGSSSSTPYTVRSQVSARAF